MSIASLSLHCHCSLCFCLAPLSSAIFLTHSMVYPQQGSKENVPALTIMTDRKGQYSVYFHAQFSALQAFSICVAILHSSEVSSTITQEKTRQRLYSNSLRLLLEEEVRHLIEAVESEEQCKAKEGAEQVPPFFLDPPFSPMGRV